MILSKYLRAFYMLVLLACIFASPANANNAPYELEIIQPRAGLTTANRYYKAYPGLLYEVRAAAVGGKYPYKYSLDASPSGMTINQNTGEIRWPSPTEKSEAYPVTLSVTDGLGATKKVSWAILVTTDKFMFVDPVNGRQGASGGIDDPVRGFYDVYGGNQYEHKYSTKLKDYFVYFKGGSTYSFDGYTGNTQGVQYTNRQPMVWLAYPGHTPTIEVSKVALRIIDTPADNFYLDGFEIKNIDTNASSEYRMGIRISGASSNVTFRKNKFHTMTNSSGAYNQSAIMMSKDEEGKGKYWSYQDNEFSNMVKAYGILGYSAYWVLIEDNLFTGFTGGGHAIGPKTSTGHWFIRRNRILDSTDDGIWLYHEFGYGHMEVSYNYVQMNSGRALAVNQSHGKNLPPSYIFRNTFVGTVNFYGVDSSVGPFYLSDNVIINGMGVSGYGCEGCSSASRINASNNLVGNSSANLISTNGHLTEKHKVHLGNKGWQVVAGSPPMPPSVPNGD